jgi:hypothetical protein
MKYLWLFLVISQIATVHANDAAGPSFKIFCQIEFKDDKGNLKKKELPITLEGHFDDPNEKCNSACSEKACKVLGFSFKSEAN